MPRFFERCTLFTGYCSEKGSDTLLSHIRVIPAKAGIQWLGVLMLINDLLDIRFRGYDMIIFLDFHVPLQLNTTLSL